jgi:hypothetical protein
MDKDPTANGVTPEASAGALGRLLLGGVAMGGQILKIAAGPSRPGDPASLPPPSPRHALIGALLQGRASLGQARRRMGPLAAAASRWANRFPPSRRLLERTRRRVAMWSDSGRREEAEARLLTLTLGEDFIRVALAVVADSPEVRSVVHEQSAGISRSALADLRERSVHADAIAAAVSDHLLGRHDRSGPRE